MYLDLFEEQQVRGLLIAPYGDVTSRLQRLRSRGIAAVLVDRFSGDAKFSSVSVDSVVGGRMAVEHLIEGGRRRLAFVGGPFDIRQVNDRLAKVCAANPKRFAAFAALPTVDPKAAADELERAVTKLGFKGAMLHGMSNGEFLDLKKFWPIYERAEKLDVPIYFHPSLPHAKVTEIYYQDYAKDFPLVVRPAWGYTVETATQAIRLVLSGLFDAHPNLKIILGHFGETLPFLLWRIDSSLKRPGQKAMSFRDIFCKNFYVTTSGFFSDPALICCMLEMGVDHILFAVDWPFVMNPPGVEWMQNVSISDSDKVKILSGNAKRLLKM